MPCNSSPQFRSTPLLNGTIIDDENQAKRRAKSGTEMGAKSVANPNWKNQKKGPKK